MAVLRYNNAIGGLSLSPGVHTGKTAKGRLGAMPTLAVGM